MDGQKSILTFPSELEAEMVRTFNAPRSLVWKAFTERDHLQRWWGLRNNQLHIDAYDFRVGGRWRFVERGADGVEHGFVGEFLEIAPEERLSYSFEYEPWPGQVLIATVSLEDQGAQTLLRDRSRFANKEHRDGMIESGMEFGGLESYTKLDELLGTLLEAGAGDDLVLERTIAAPRDLVWKLFTETEHLMKWWGPKGFTMKVARNELRPGGVYHYGMASPQGHEMWGKFVYTEVEAPARLGFINSFSDADGGLTRHPLSDSWPLELENLYLFADPGPDTTRLTMIARPINATPEEMATFLGARAGVAGGMDGTLQQLNEYLAGLQQPERAGS
jgi:uncharacterized protein YndB with AHSA1/START domain